MHVVCSNSDSPCSIKDMPNEDIVVIEVCWRDRETGKVEVGIILAIEASLFVIPDVNKGKGALDESRLALPFQKANRWEFGGHLAVCLERGCVVGWVTLLECLIVTPRWSEETEGKQPSC